MHSHICRPAAMTALLACLAVVGAARAASPYATEVVDASTTGFGGSPYDDPEALLGSPSTMFYDPWGAWSGGDSVRLVKMVEPPYNLDETQANKLITTFNRVSNGGGYDYGYTVVKFDAAIYDDEANPYGIDFEVFGNSFYVGGGTSGGFVNDETNMEDYYLAGGIFAEPVVVSVSPGYQGLAGEDENDSSTWQWYTYTAGPYGDSAFATHAYAWDRENAAWTDDQMDFTKPVNPTLDSVLGTTDTSSAYYQMCVADAIDLYAGSGGGTGFDLAESGFEYVQYIRVEATSDHYGGEIDAFSDVRAMVVGEALSIAAANLTEGTATLYFQNPEDVSATMIRAEFTSVDDILQLSTDALTDAALLDLVAGTLRSAYEIDVASILNADAGDPDYLADLYLLADGYVGDGSDLSVFVWNDDAWQAVSFTYDEATNMVLLADWSSASAPLAISQVPEPSMVLVMTVGGVLAAVRRRRHSNR